MSALGPEEYVYQGVWTDWERGKYFGPTLTVDAHTARILSPALALLITTTGFSVWKLCRYAIHQTRAKAGRHEVLYHQTQVILRNSSTDLDVVNKFLLLAIAWRNRKDTKLLKHIFPSFLAAILHFAFFVAFGILSSWSLQAPDRVLSRSPWCGTWNSSYHDQVFSLNYSSLASVALANEYSSYVNSRYTVAQQNADLCHNDLDGCPTAKIKSLKWTSNFIANGCPASNVSICHPHAGGSLQFDTGYLSSHSDLGYNAKPEDRVKFRMVAECAPLKSDGYVTDWQEVPPTADLPARQVVNVYYGGTKSSNSTYQRTKRTYDCSERKLIQPYTLISHLTQPGGSIASLTATFNAIPALMPVDRDLSLILLTFDNAYSGLVSDPWFSAQKPINVSESFCLNKNNTVYVREREVTALACTQQWQFCDNMDKPGDITACTGLDSISAVRKEMLDMAGKGQFNDLQSATGQRIYRTGLVSTFYYITQALSQAGSPPLKAREFVSYQSQPALSVNQWQTEASYWMDLILEYFQQANLDTSTGQFAPSTSYINVTKATSGDSQAEKARNAAYSLCQNQVISSRDFSNYNFVALVLTVVLCIVLIAGGYSVECCTTSTRQRKLNYTGGNGKQDMWNANCDLDMLQRLDEFKNGTTWTRACNGVPVAHSSHQIDMEELVPYRFQVDDGSGVVLPAVQRRRELTEKGFKSTTSLTKSTTCITCEAVGNESGSSNPDLTRGLLQSRHAGDAGLVGQSDISDYRSGYHNDFRRDFQPDMREASRYGHIC